MRPSPSEGHDLSIRKIGSPTKPGIRTTSRLPVVKQVDEVCLFVDFSGERARTSRSSRYEQGHEHPGGRRHAGPPPAGGDDTLTPPDPCIRCVAGDVAPASPGPGDATVTPRRSTIGSAIPAGFRGGFSRAAPGSFTSGRMREVTPPLVGRHSSSHWRSPERWLKYSGSSSAVMTPARGPMRRRKT